MKNAPVFTADDFRNEDGDAASPETAAILANDRTAKVLSALATLRSILLGLNCHCSPRGNEWPYQCPACRSIEIIERLTDVFEEQEVTNG